MAVPPPATAPATNTAAPNKATDPVSSVIHPYDSAPVTTTHDSAASNPFAASNQKPFLSSNAISSVAPASFPLPLPRLSLDMEPNPFEQSFKERESSAKPPPPPSSSSSADLQAQKPLSNHVSVQPVITLSLANTDPTKPAVGAANQPSLFSNNNQFLSPDRRRVLPPMSSISSTNPQSALPNATNPGNPDWSDSLRSGPLSPAMLQGPAPQQASTSGLSSSLLSLAGSAPLNTSSTSPVVANTNINNTPTAAATAAAIATANAIRPGPLSPFLQSSLLGTDASALFPTPGPATAAILNSLNSDLIGATGLTPLPLKSSMTSGATASILPAVASLSQSTQGVQMPDLAPTNPTTIATAATTIATSKAQPTTSSTTYNGSVDAAASLYMMSKGNSQPYQSQNPQQPQPPQIPVHILSGIKTETPDFDPSINSILASQQSAAQEPALLPFSHLAPKTNQLSSDDFHQTLPNTLPLTTSAPATGLPATAPAAKRGRGSATKKAKRRKGQSAETLADFADEEKPSNTSRGRGKKADTKSKTKKENAAFKKKASADEYEDDEDDEDDLGLDDTGADNSKQSFNDTPKSEKRKLTEEEKRKSFLERNRIAALKCRQRKKQWVQELQTKVETYASQNEVLNRQVSVLQDEVIALRTALLNHRGCSLGLEPDLLASLLATQPGAAGVARQIPGINPVSSAQVVQSLVSQQQSQVASTMVTNAQIQNSLSSAHLQHQAASVANPVATGNATASVAPGVIPAHSIMARPQQVQAQYGYQQPLYPDGSAQPDTRQLAQGASQALLQTTGAAR